MYSVHMTFYFFFESAWDYGTDMTSKQKEFAKQSYSVPPCRLTCIHVLDHYNFISYF